MSDSPFFSRLYGPLFASASMRDLCGDGARLQRLLDVEAALARAEAAVNIIPRGAADSIGAACRASAYDLDALSAAAVGAGNLAIPVVKALTAQVAKTEPSAAGYVHWGATSQDILDSAMMLELGA